MARYKIKLDHCVLDYLEFHSTIVQQMCYTCQMKQFRIQRF